MTIPMKSFSAKRWSIGKIFSTLFLLSSNTSLCAGTRFNKKSRRVKEGTFYEKHDDVHIVVNKVGPFYNPSETYKFYSLPFCDSHVTDKETDIFIDRMSKLNPHPVLIEDLSHTHKGDRIGGERHYQRLGEKLTGNRRESSPYEITFADDLKWRPLCHKELSVDDVLAFKDAIHNDWFFEMFVEDLPMWGYIGEVVKEDFIIGEVEGSSTFLFTHLNFKFGTNNGNIVSAQSSVDRSFKVELTDEPVDVHFSYSVQWETSSLQWKDRMSTYIDNQFDSNVKIHWLSIINSIVLVMLLMSFLTIILVRIVKNDFVDVEDQGYSEDEAGWKLIHGDVFRFPNHICIFASAIGTGLQLALTAIVVSILALSGTISTTRRGSILTATVVSYCLLSLVGGYGSGSLYSQFGGKNWSRNALCTALLFPGPLFLIFCTSNSVAIMHKSTSALTFGAIVTILALYFLLSLPLTIVGSIYAKNENHKFSAPTRTTKVAREIPTEIPWYMSRVMQLLVCSTIPFSAIYIEMNYIFASMWGHQIYTLFGILFVSLLLIIVVTSFMAVTVLYFQLTCEDHRWWWNSFINGGSIGFMMLLYSFVYFVFKTEMNGVLQASFFFGYMAALSYACFLITGTAAFYSSLTFVRFIFSRIKCD